MPSDRHLNVLSFDIPYPPDYGGVVEVYCKLKALHAAGIRIHLHCFEYGRERQDILKKYCASVHYYPRKTARSLLFNTLPYIVLSRNAATLKKNLLRNNYPILMEGLHTTYLLGDKELQRRRIVVRTHNVEHDYYENLAKVENNIFKRYYFYNEAGKLRKYEAILKQASAIAAISPADTAYFKAHYKNVSYLPAFHPNSSVTCREGKGAFAFYHGNLSVGENNEAAMFLVTRVFNNLPQKLVIAGNKPSDELVNAVRGRRNITLMTNVRHEKIHVYIREAQCNVLPTFQATGIKLKLLSALYAGRFCIVNRPMVEHTGLESLCIVANTPERMKEKIRDVMNGKKEFTQKDIQKREKVLLENFSNEKSAAALIRLLY
jgi:glycosyltransferase involved in cell wall biosynthesis